MIISDPSRHPRVSGREGAPAVNDDQPAERSEGTAIGSPFRAEEHGCPVAGETAAADGAGSTAAGTGTVPLKGIKSLSRSVTAPKRTNIQHTVRMCKCFRPNFRTDF